VFGNRPQAGCYSAFVIVDVALRKRIDAGMLYQLSQSAGAFH